MLDLPGQPVLDKGAIIGGCIRLPISLDSDGLRAEVNALPTSLWGTTSGRVGVHRAADAVFLRGFAPAEGLRPIEDRPPLAMLPYLRSIIDSLIPAQPQRCLLARLPGGATIAPHVDRAPYFSKTIRIHVPVESHDRVWMLCSDLVYVMKPGEIWALNNSTTHAVWNADPSVARTHLICDFLPSPELFDLLARGERELGQQVPEVQDHFDDVVAARVLSERPGGSAGASAMGQ
jgi:hypothetical protein